MSGNIQEQINLEKKHGKYIMELENHLKSNQLPTHQRANVSSASTQTPQIQDASTNTYDLTVSLT